MRWEFDHLNLGIVTKPKSLRTLLEPDAHLETRDGDSYDVDRAVLTRLADACSPPEREGLRIPITIHFTADVPDTAYVIDELAANVLHRLEGWGPAYPYRDGKMWIPASVAVDILLRYGGALQRLMR